MRSPIQVHLEMIHRQISQVSGGAVADYIDALAGVDPGQFGICLTTADGYSYHAGDSRTEFSIQSVSKPFTYAFALADRGFDLVDALIDVEPSGEAYNEISLQPGTNRPANALINAGAIAATSLIRASDQQSRRQRLVEFYSCLAGRNLRLDPVTARQERENGHRNLAMAHLLKSVGLLQDEPQDAANDYFASCAVMVTTEDLALMAATLATGGTQPRTGQRLISPTVVRRVLSVLSTCGMYDDAGRWMVKVGLPGKSGVGGGIMAVLPGHLGLAVWSPPLDSHGNSVRGVLACERLSADLGLHMMNGSPGRRSTVRSRRSLIAESPSRPHNAADRAFLAAHQHLAEVVTLQGRLVFSTAEQVVRSLVEGRDRPTPAYVVLDVCQVTESAAFLPAMLRAVAGSFAEDGRTLVVVDDTGTVIAQGAEGPSADLRLFADRGTALAWVEDQLLGQRE